MSSYNKRRWEMLIDGEPFIEQTTGRQFKCTFEILHDFGGFTSYADIKVMNLTEDTANKAFKRGKSITFRAGYEQSIDTIFSGVIRNIIRGRVGATTSVQLICRGGKLTDEQGTINETLGANTKLTDIIRACGTALGYPIVMDDTQFEDVEPYIYGYPMQGDPRVYLDKLAATHNFSYVVENDKLVVVRKGFYRDGTVHVISQLTGMEGIPELTEVGADVTTRLNPKIRIGGRFRIESTLATFNFSNLYFRDIPESAGQGEYNIFRIAYTGDTWGDAWSNKITGIR